MAMNYHDLDDKTREYMLKEFEKEENGGNPYRSKTLSMQGVSVFPDLIRNAIKSGNEISLCSAIEQENYWDSQEAYTRSGITRTRRRNIAQSAKRLVLSEFSTWYVRGFAKRLLDEGVEKCRVYRGEQPKWEPGECAMHEGLVVSVQEVYENHRVRYWPEPGNIEAFSVPFGPGCHHIIERVK